MPTALTFAGRTRERIWSADLDPHSTRCHAAVLYWMFRDFGDTRPDALAKLRAISVATCAHHAAGRHTPIPAQWFGRQLYVVYDQIAQRTDLQNNVDVGDVLVTGHPSLPNHSMVVVTHRYTAWHSNTNIRGFNNRGTFGAGPWNEYDPAERHCDVAGMWHGGGFGYAAPGNNLYRVRFDDYVQCARILRVSLLLPGAAAGTFDYTGPT
jgi:hypothetical protein